MLFDNPIGLRVAYVIDLLVMILLRRRAPKH